MPSKNILVFPAGTEISFEIANALKYSKFVRLIGGTSADDHAEFVYGTLVKGFPYIHEERFLDYLNRVIDEYAIDWIYPAHDSACVWCSEHREEIHAGVIVTDSETVRICRSKKETYRVLAGETFIPRTYESPDEVDAYPVFVKPSVGQGSQGARKIDSRAELERALAQDATLVICEYLPDTEYTVDCFTDRHGELRVAKLRDRQRIRAGISVRSRELPVDDDVQDIADRLNQRLHFRGAWFFQIKKNAAGRYRLMEISPRIPGTMGLSRNLGINFPMLTLFDFWNMDVEILENHYDILLDRAFYSAYSLGLRYSHIYLDYDDTLVVDGKVNGFLMMYLYQAVSAGKRIHLLSKHIGDLREDLRRFRVAEQLFDEICVIRQEEQKSDYIAHTDAIFIDDSFAERQRVQRACGIPVFDLDMIESLIDWRI